MDIQRSEKPQNDQSGSNGETHNQSSRKQTANNQSGMTGPVLVIIGLIVVAVVLVFAFNGGDMNSNQSGPVATVGDASIERSEFQEQIETLQTGTSSQAQRFQQLSENRQQSLILSGLIDNELLVQAAENADVSVSDSEVQSRLQSQIQQIGTSTFESRLQQNNLTREEVRSNLREQMLVSRYVSQSPQGSATTTEQEIQQLYDQYSSRLKQAGTSTDVPSLEELRPQLEASIQQRKQQQARQQLLQQARQNINVEVMLEGVSYPPESQSAQQGQSPQTQPQTQPAEASESSETESTTTDTDDAEASDGTTTESQ